MPENSPNQLYYGDNLDVLRLHVLDESVDLVYLDPPFNSNANYNVLFAERDGTQAAAQIKVFEDTWRWDEGAARAYADVVEAGGRVSQAMQAFRTFLGETDMLAYLAMMAPRLVELRRVLKSSGSIYLHCDSTASHYLKMLLDSVFRPQNFKAEIVWQRSSAHSDTSQGLKKPGRIHDLLLYYTKSSEWTWNPQFTAYSDEYVRQRFKNVDARGAFKDADLTAAKPGGIRRTRGTSSAAPRIGGRMTWMMSGSRLGRVPCIDPSRRRLVDIGHTAVTTWSPSKRAIACITSRQERPRLKQHAADLPGIGLQDIWDRYSADQLSGTGAAWLPHTEARGAACSHYRGQQQRG